MINIKYIQAETDTGSILKIKKKIDTILIIKSNQQEHRPTHSDLEARVQLDGSDRVGHEQMQELV